MIKSMTGFGRGSCVQNGFGITVEMRSVNHRYADFILRLPRELYLLEDKIRHLLQQEIERGRLEVSVTLEEPPPGTRAVKVDLQLAEELCQAVTMLSRNLSLNLDINSAFASLLPEILSIQHSPADEELVWSMLQECFQQALSELVKQRRQ
ncbi:MAG TPA: hypothetical protein GX693_05365, partial [Firmicutes bacterium]|nr:hypothetical protein [Bacillota bacterium]